MLFRSVWWLSLAVLLTFRHPFGLSGFAAPQPVRSVLRVNSQNPRYFTDDSGKAIYLTGSHTWANLQDQGTNDPPKSFDFPRYLDFLTDHHHNFIRLWSWEQARSAPWADGKDTNPTDWFIQPNPYARSGRELARDGKPKFDLNQFDDAYFRRLRERVRQAGARGIYVSIMLFQGWSSEKGWLGGKPWIGHPYNPRNNVQGFNGNPHGEGGPYLNDPAVRERQAAYIRHVIDTVNDLDNVLYEVINEGGEKDWDWWVVRTVHEYEKTKPKQHPVGLTGHGSENNDELLSSPADWVSLGSQSWPDLKTEPRAFDGRKVNLLDTDHVWGVGGTYQWVWKVFLRGHNLLFMDPYDDPSWEPILAAQGLSLTDVQATRRAMGRARLWSQRIDLAKASPHGELVSSGYCLAVPGQEYLAYVPDHQEVTVDLSGSGGAYAVEWFEPGKEPSGEPRKGSNVQGGAKALLKKPLKTADAVVYLRRLE